MKPLFIVALLLTSTVVTHAQREQGSKMVGAGVGRVGLFVQPYNNNSTQTSISLYPSAGYFIRDNFVVGSGLSLGFSSYSGRAGFSIGIDPFSRYYFSGTEQRSSFFVEAQLGYSWHKYWNYANFPDHYRVLSASVGPGFAWFINPYVSFESTLLLQANASAISPSVLGANMNFGFQIYLSQNKAAKEVKSSDAEQSLEVAPQRERGGKLIGISLGSVSGFVEPFNNSGAGFSLNPKAGYFVRDNFLVGSSVGVGYFTAINGGHSVSYSVQPFIRRYFSKTERITSLFFEAQIGVLGNRSKGDNSEVNTNYIVTAAPGLGFAYFINPYVSVETEFEIQAYSFVFNDHVLLNPSISVGFQVYLPGKSIKPIESPDLH